MDPGPAADPHAGGRAVLHHGSGGTGCRARGGRIRLVHDRRGRWTMTRTAIMDADDDRRVVLAPLAEAMRKILRLRCPCVEHAPDGPPMPANGLTPPFVPGLPAKISQDIPRGAACAAITYDHGI